jgi:site-specific recombinase XerD
MSSNWSDPEIRFSKAQENRVEEFRAWLRTSKTKLARELADPPGTFTVTRTTASGRREMRRLEKALILDRPSTSAAHIDSQILLKFVAHQNRFGAKLPIPRISTLFTYPSNPFADDVIGARERIQEWKKAEHNWIENAGAKPSLALIVFSGILHGGLLHKNCISAFARTLLEPAGKIGYVGHQITVALDLAWNGIPSMEFRSWQPDISTACAIVPPKQMANTPSLSVDELRAFTDEQLCRTILKQVVEEMKRSGTPKELRPRTLKQMIDVVALGARTEVPAILVDYATRHIVSHSVRSDVLQRIYAQRGLQSNEQTNLQSPKATPGADNRSEDATLFVSSNESENPDDQEPKGLKRLRAALNVSSEETALQELRALLHEIDKRETRQTVWHLITQFAEYLLCRRQVVRPGAFSKRNLALSTVKAYAVNLVGRRFGRLLEGKGPLDLNAIEFEDYYTQAIENSLGDEATNRQKRALIGALREFHDFLVQEHGAAPIRDSDVFGAVRGLLPVDATIITLEEYNEAREFIRLDIQNMPDLRVRQIAEAILILGFKCGARRMEALNLSIADLLIKGEPWLFIRPWGDHALKTINAKRQIPLRSLLDEDELDVLLDCLDGAKALSKNNKFLFGISDKCSGFRVIPQDMIMPIVHRALREATKDTRIRFHHCRHSFATWTLLRLMLSDLESIPDLFPHLPETRTWLQDSKRFRRVLYAGDGNQTRKHLRAVASLLGHSGPLMSLEHYIHCLDWLLPHFLASSKLLGNARAQDVATLARRAESSVYGAAVDSDVWLQNAITLHEKRLKKSKADRDKRLHRVIAAVEERLKNLKKLKVDRDRHKHAIAILAKRLKQLRADRDKWMNPPLSIPVRVFRERFPEIAPSYATSFKPVTKQDDSGAPSILDHWSVLFLRQTTKECLESIAERFGLEPEKADVMIGRIKALHKIKEPRGKQAKRHKKLFQLPEKNAENPKPGLLYPKRPHSNRSGKFISEFERPLMSCAQKHRSLTESVLRYYVNNIWSSENVLVFRNPADPQRALDYLRFLKELEFGNPGKAPIRLVSFDMAENSKTRDEWQIALGITDSEWEGVVKRDPLFAPCRANRKWLSIGPDLDSPEDEAYRFLMIMAAIAFGFAP